MKESWHTIKALIKVFPPSSNEPPVAARTEDEAEARQSAANERRDDMSMMGMEPCSIIGGKEEVEEREKEEKVRGQACCCSLGSWFSPRSHHRNLPQTADCSLSTEVISKPSRVLPVHRNSLINIRSKILRKSCTPQSLHCQSFFCDNPRPRTAVHSREK
jgi:hypothetical protein